MKASSKNGSDQLKHKQDFGVFSSLFPQHYAPDYGSCTKDDSSNNSDSSNLLPGGISSNSQQKKIGLASLVVLIYYEVSGGPFGIEDIVRAGGPLYAILGFSLFFVWVIPEALVTAELSTALPEASGAVGENTYFTCYNQQSSLLSSLVNYSLGRYSVWTFLGLPKGMAVLVEWSN